MERGRSGGYGRGGGYAGGRTGGNSRGGGRGRGFDHQQHQQQRREHGQQPSGAWDQHHAPGAGAVYQQRRDRHDNQQLGGSSGIHQNYQPNQRREQQNKQPSSSWRPSGDRTQVQAETVPSSIDSGEGSSAGGGVWKFPRKDWIPTITAPVQPQTPYPGMDL